MVFARVALLLAGGAAVKFVLALQAEDDAARAGDARDATDAPVDRRLGRVRPAVSRREPAAGANAEEAPGPVAAAEPASSPDTARPGVLALTPAASEAEETRAVDETREVSAVAVEATERTETDPETRSTGPPVAHARETVGPGAPVEPEAGRVPPRRSAVRAVTFASPEPSPAAASSEPSLVSDRHASSSGEECSDSEDDDEDDAVASRIAAEYLASLPFVLPPGAAFPETPGVGARRPAVCASPFIAADGARRVIRGEGGKGNFVRRKENGGAAPRPPKDPLPLGARASDNQRPARTPGPKTTDALAGLAYPKTPGPTLDGFDDFDDDFEDDGDENESRLDASPLGGGVKLHVSLEDLKGRYGGAVSDSRERYRASPLAEVNGEETETAKTEARGVPVARDGDNAPRDVSSRYPF